MKGEDLHPRGLRRHRQYEAAFKQHAVDLTLQSDRKLGTIAQELGLPVDTLYRWRHQYLKAQAAPPLPDWPRSAAEKDAEIHRLRAEVERLRERELVLKKSLGILSEAPGSGMPRSRR